MKAKEVWYDEEADVLNIEINSKEYWKSIELPNGVVIDMAKDGTITSIEILKEDLENAPFNQLGGLGKEAKVFGTKLTPLLKELNEKVGG